MANESRGVNTLNERDQFTVNHQQATQESEYRVPYHWLLRKAGKAVYTRKSDIMAGLVKKRHEPRRILDLGCGDGKGTYDIAVRFPKASIIGVDFSDRAVAFARLMAESIDFRVQKAAKTDFGDQEFDLIVSREVIEHIAPNEVDGFLLEIRRLLEPRGYCLLTTPSENRRVPEKHFQHFTVEKLRVSLARCGLELIDSVGFGYWPPAGIEKFYRKLIGLPSLWRIHRYFGRLQINPDKADNLIVLAQKSGSKRPSP